MILKLQEVWVTPKVTTWKGHLEDFPRATKKTVISRRLVGSGTVRGNVTNILKNVQDLSNTTKLTDVRFVNQEGKKGLTTWEEHLEDFDESYQKHGDFKKARGKNSGPRPPAPAF